MREHGESHELPIHNLGQQTIETAPGSTRSLVATVLSIVPRNFFAILVDIFKPAIFRRKSSNRRPLHPTAFIDGLRGWAAFSVCIVHLTVYTHPKIEECYGYPVDPHRSIYNTGPAAWPIGRILFSSGHFAVMLFFVISGYVITRKPISLLHEGRPSDFVEALNSAIVRRPLRLLLPVAWSTLFFAFCWQLFCIAIPWPEKQKGLGAELAHWLREMMMFGYFFRDGHMFTNYNMHTWTIPVELRGSLSVFVWLFALHQVENRVRILMTLAMMLYLVFAAPGVWYAAFFFGMMVAEMDLLGSVESTVKVRLPWDGLLKAIRSKRLPRSLTLHAMLIVGLCLGSEPSSDWPGGNDHVLGTCRGWKGLSKFIPSAYNESNVLPRWFWLFWAACLVLVSVKEIDWAKRLLESNFSQYLGKHSFALYLTHNFMTAMVSERLFYLAGVKKGPLDAEEHVKFGHLLGKWSGMRLWPFSDAGPYGLESNYLFCMILSLVVFLYVADLGTRLWDAPSVQFSRWAYGRLKRTAQ